MARKFQIFATVGDFGEKISKGEPTKFKINFSSYLPISFNL
jgi:hypothetical protein